MSNTKITFVLILFRKVYRKSFDLVSRFTSIMRVVHLKIKYPTLSINFGTKIGKNCQIISTDNPKMVLKNVVIANGVILRADNGGFLQIENSYIGFYSVIIAAKQIDIKNNSQIAEMVVIRDQDHDIGFKGFKTGEIHIGENVWIASKATILRNVTIENNAIIGASSVVRNCVVESNSLYVGIPAKFKKKL